MVRVLVMVLLGGMLAACGGEGDAVAPDVAAVPEHPGKSVYQQSCFSCHYGGIGGAPRVGDAEAWGERLAKGRDVLLASTLNGLGTMPAMGLCRDCTEDDLNAAIDYMLAESGVE